MQAHSQSNDSLGESISIHSKSFTSLEEGFKGRVFLLLSLDLQYAKWCKIFDFDSFLKMSLWCFTGVIFLSLENFGGDVPGSVVGYVNVHPFF